MLEVPGETGREDTHMTQFYKAINLDKHEYLSPFGFGGRTRDSNGERSSEESRYVRCKELMAVCYVGNAFVNALTALVAGPWHGDRVMYISDCAWYYGVVRRRAVSGSILLRELSECGEFACNPFLVSQGWDDAAGRCYVPDMLNRVFNGWDGDNQVWKTIAIPGHTGTLDCGQARFIVNETRGVYYDREKLVESVLQNSTLDPLLIFLAVGNYLGSGDYKSSEGQALVGSWACQTISASNERPEGLSEIASPFDPYA